MNRKRSLPRVHIVGRRNSGKTTLVCDLVKELSDRGLKVATVKHTHHRHELDTPGKDSWKHRQAGAAGVGILSPHMLAAFVPSERAADDGAGYRRMELLFEHCDLLLVEGDLETDAWKLEVWHPDTAAPPYAADRTDIHAVITDSPPAAEFRHLPRSDLAAVADEILNLTDTGG